MQETHHQRITSIHFRNYKAFSDFSVSFDSFNVLVGPNNAGKSTVLGAIRILAEGLRKARSRKPEWLQGMDRNVRGYQIDLDLLPVSTENVFHNYNDSIPALVTFRLSNGVRLILNFPEKGVCYLIPEGNRPIKAPSDFKKEFGIKISATPVLGPVEHNEQLFQKESARLALLSHGASRNFRNIWHHYPEAFSEFRRLLRETWPGMDINPPEIFPGDKHSILCMFCPEERFPREIFWAGFGFQVWCQMLTFILQAKDSALLLVDEPDIYLHSDLQRQLVSILRDLGPDILIATHSTEIISEVDSEAILNINKKFRSAKRIKNSNELQSIFATLGSNLNPTLTQLAKTRRVVFVEGKDFQIISRFARRLSQENVANRSHFAVVPVGGFNPQKVKDFASGMDLTLGSRLGKLVLFDRDYRSGSETRVIEAELRKFCWKAIIHDRKEVENYLLHPNAISRAIVKRLSEDQKRTGPTPSDIEKLLRELAHELKNEVQSQLVTSGQKFQRSTAPGQHASVISKEVMNEFDAKWNIFEDQMKIVPGKDILSALNQKIQKVYKVSITPASIIDSFLKTEIPMAMTEIVNVCRDFANTPFEE